MPEFEDLGLRAALSELNQARDAQLRGVPGSFDFDQVLTQLAPPDTAGLPATPLPVPGPTPGPAPIVPIFPTVPAANDPVFRQPTRVPAVARAGGGILGVGLLAIDILRQAGDQILAREQRQIEARRDRGRRQTQRILAERGAQRTVIITSPQALPQPDVLPPPGSFPDLPEAPRLPRPVSPSVPQPEPLAIPAPVPLPAEIPAPSIPSPTVPRPTPSTQPGQTPLPAGVPGIGSPTLPVWIPSSLPPPAALPAALPFWWLSPRRFWVGEAATNPANLTRFNTPVVESPVLGNVTALNPATAAQPATERCAQVRKRRRRRNVCAEGFFRELPNGDVENKIWRERECFSGRVINETGRISEVQGQIEQLADVLDIFGVGR